MFYLIHPVTLHCVATSHASRVADLLAKGYRHVTESTYRTVVRYNALQDSPKAYRLAKMH